MMNDTSNAGPQVRHKLQIHFDARECEPAPDEFARMSDNLDTLARQVGDFPQADLRVVIERNGRDNEFVVKLTLLLPDETVMASDHDPVLHAAFRRALDSLELRFKGYYERLSGVDARQQQKQAARFQPTIEAGLLDDAALDAAAASGDYAAFRAAIAPYEDWVRLRVGRWVERYPDVQARMGREFDVLDISEGVFVAAFERHAHWRPEVRYRNWLEGLIDPTVRAFAHDAAREMESVKMARSAAAAPRV